MTKARDLADLGSTATVMATDAELAAAIAAIPTPDVTADIFMTMGA